VESALFATKMEKCRVGAVESPTSRVIGKGEGKTFTRINTDEHGSEIGNIAPAILEELF